jgi:hypothetical protein
VTEVFYGCQWHQVRPGSFQRIKTNAGIAYHYEDPFSEETVFVVTDIKGYKFRKPDPPEPKASITQLHKK